MSGPWERDEQEKKMSAALEKVAKEVGTEHITAGKSSSQFRQWSIEIKVLLVCVVAIAYVMQKAPYVFPIIGGRKVEHLLGNIEALSISLSPEQIAYLESIVPFDPGFPNSMIVRLCVSTAYKLMSTFFNRVMGLRQAHLLPPLLISTNNRLLRQSIPPSKRSGSSTF